MESKLMPCPFCGSEKVSIMHPNDEYTGAENKNEHFIYCAGCLFESGVYLRKDTLMKLWNRRVNANDK